MRLKMQGFSYNLMLRTMLTPHLRILYIMKQTYRGLVTLFCFFFFFLKSRIS